MVRQSSGPEQPRTVARAEVPVSDVQVKVLHAGCLSDCAMTAHILVCYMNSIAAFSGFFSHKSVTIGLCCGESLRGLKMLYECSSRCVIFN